VCAYLRLRVRTSAADTSKIQQAAAVALDLGPARQGFHSFLQRTNLMLLLCVQSSVRSATTDCTKRLICRHCDLVTIFTEERSFFNILIIVTTWVFGYEYSYLNSNGPFDVIRKRKASTDRDDDDQVVHRSSPGTGRPAGLDPFWMHDDDDK